MQVRAPGGVDWTPYLELGAGVGNLLRDLSPAEARAARDSLAARRQDRIKALKVLLASQGIELNGSDESIQKLNNWFISNVEESIRDAGKLAPIWYSVLNDIALFLGELLIKKTGVLEWEFEVASQGTPYRTVDHSLHPTLTLGLGKNRGIVSRIGLDDHIAEYAHAVIAKQHVAPDYFIDLLLAGVASV